MIDIDIILLLKINIQTVSLLMIIATMKVDIMTVQDLGHLLVIRRFIQVV